MKKNIIATLVGIAALGLAPSTHYALRHNEQKKLDNIPKIVRQIDITRDYFSNGLVNEGEASNLLLSTYKNSGDILTDSQFLTTEEGLMIRHDLRGICRELEIDEFTVKYGRMHEAHLEKLMDSSDSDIKTKLDECLENYSLYLETSEYYRLVKPLNVKERLLRHWYNFLDG